MILAPGTDEFLARYHAAMPQDFFGQSVAEQRRLYLSLSDVFPYDLPDGVTITDHEVVRSGRRFAFRAYRPARRAGRGTIVYFHGGGFILGSVQSHHTLAAELAAATELLTISVEFPLAPENPFPAAAESCFEVLCALAEGPFADEADTATPVLCGDSSGANLAVALSMMCRDRGGPHPRGQGLIGPVLDFARWFEPDLAQPFAEEMQHYARAYCPRRELAEHPYASPLVSGTFDGLPPAYIMSTEYDELRDDAVQYTRRLEEQGTAVRLVVEPGLVHAPVRGRSLIPQVADAWKRFCTAVGELAVDRTDGAGHAGR